MWSMPVHTFSNYGVGTDVSQRLGTLPWKSFAPTSIFIIYYIYEASRQFTGIISRLDYLEDIGVETICLNPIYRSPLVDSGYDVADYKDVHPMFGSLDDFDELIQDIHKRGTFPDDVAKYSSSISIQLIFREQIWR